MTKPEAIIEFPGAPVWDTNFGRLSNSQSVPNINSSNCFRYEINSKPPSTLFSSDPVPLPQSHSSENIKPTHGKFYEEIIKDSMSGLSFGDPQNPKVRRLCSTASSLAATALAPSTKDNYGRAWGHFKTFCSTVGFDPLEVSVPEIATWLVHRAEQTSSPNVLESDLKSIKCFRLAAKRPNKDFYIAEATLKGYLKKLEAKPRLRLGLEPEVVQILIQNALSLNGERSFVEIRQAAVYALMYYLTARFEEVKDLE